MHHQVNGLRSDRADEPEVERAIGAVTGGVLTVVACFAAALVPAADPSWRLAVVALAVGVTAAMTGDLTAMVVVAVTAFLLVDGFLVDTRGQLGWHGQDDVLRLGALMAAGLAGLGLHRLNHLGHSS